MQKLFDPTDISLYCYNYIALARWRRDKSELFDQTSGHNCPIKNLIRFNEQ